MLLGTFIWVVDVKEWRWWVEPFLWIGSNSMAAYFFGNFVRLDAWLGAITGGASFGSGAEAFFAVLRVGLTIGFVYVLHKKEIYIRV